jgi:hypothetical protein
MPTYYVRNKKTGEYVLAKEMTISEMEKYEKELKKAAPGFEIACGAPGIGYSFNRLKPSQGFRDRLRDIKKSHPGSTINVS